MKISEVEKKVDDGTREWSNNLMEIVEDCQQNLDFFRGGSWSPGIYLNEVRLQNLHG